VENLLKSKNANKVKQEKARNSRGSVPTEEGESHLTLIYTDE
jgi:hypothetical protein